MTTKNKISQLRETIKGQLLPLIDHDYWLLNVPYHNNIGDVLIWQGELDFLRTIKHKRKGMSSYKTDIPSQILPDDIILIHGGGNFGDLWTTPQDYQMDVVKRYPNNKIIFMPQTVYWQDSDNMRDCAKLLGKAPNVIICARDQNSYDLLVSNFKNRILLVPDMAFYINTKHWRTPNTTRKVLLLKRDDAELKQYDLINKLCAQQDVDVLDWPTFNETEGWQRRWFRRTKKYAPQLYDWYAKTIMMPYIINRGVQLIGTYNRIYSTRLHAAILSVLLGKASELVWFDNSYGKNSNFYDTWLKDCEGIQFIR